MTDCADSTMLRAHLDHPSPELDAHLDVCDACAGLLRSVASDAGYTRNKLALLEVADHVEHVDTEAALAAACAAAVATPVVPPPGRRSRPPTATARRLILSGVGVLVVVVMALTPAGRGAIAATLDAFRGERFQAFDVNLDDWAASPGRRGLQVLEALGEVDTAQLAEPVEVLDVGRAEEVSGISAPVVPEPPDRLVALAPGSVRVVFASGDGNGVPPELDGAALVVDVPGAIGAIYGPADGPPEMVIGRSGPLVLRAEGAPLARIRSFLLAHDELPADLRARLAAIDDWRSTIPVPVPLDGPGWEEIEVAGRPAIAFGDDSGVGALVLRHDPAGVTVVGGRISITRAIELAAEA